MRFYPFSYYEVSVPTGMAKQGKVEKTLLLYLFIMFFSCEGQTRMKILLSLIFYI